MQYSLSLLCTSPQFVTSLYSFSPPYIKSAYGSFPVYTLLVSSCFCNSSHHQVIISKVYRNTATVNAPIAVILFLVSSSDFSIVLNVPVLSLFSPSFICWRYKPPHYSVQSHLYVFSYSARVFLCWYLSLHFASELISLSSVQSLWCTCQIPIPYWLSQRMF